MDKRKQYTKGKGRKPFPKDERSSDQFKGKKKECANDPEWYTVSGQMLKDVASINFNNPAGIRYTLDPDASSVPGTFVAPGVMDIFVAPAPGYSEGLTSPINIAAKNIYSWVRHANSGHSNYDSPDLMLMILGMANAYAFYAWMTRVYGMARVYSQDNRYLGLNMAKACFVDATSISQNLAAFRAYINQYALKLSALSVPATMSLFKRYMWMFSNVYMDENTTKAQFYMYQPAYFYKYVEDSGGAGYLEPKPLCLKANGLIRTTFMTYSDIANYGDDLLGALIASEDINIMSGDILKAYGESNVWKLQTIDENYAIAPMFSEEVLLQIHNTIFAGTSPLKSTDDTSATGWDSFRVTQDPSIGEGCLICKPIVKFGANVQFNHLLDTWMKDMSPEYVMVATRNMLTGMRWAQGFTAITGFGTEIPMFAAICVLDQAGGVPSFQGYYQYDSKSVINSSYPTAADCMTYLSKLEAFNEHPQMYMIQYNGNTFPYAELDASSSIGELSNFTVLDFNDIERMHLTAILSELAVPLLGNLAK